MTLFVELEVSPEDRGRRHALGFRLSDDDDRVLKEVPIQFSVPPDYPRPTAPLDPTLFELPFERFGPYYLDIFVAGAHARRLYLTVRPRET